MGTSVGRLRPVVRDPCRTVSVGGRRKFRRKDSDEMQLPERRKKWEGSEGVKEHL